MSRETQRPAKPRESSVLREVLLALGNQPDLVVFRNNTGVLRDETGRPVRYGLMVGSPDIVGILAPWGRFVGFEVKRPGGKQSPDQERWARIAETRGAYCVLVQSAKQALDVLAVIRVQTGLAWGMKRMDGR